MDLHIQVEELSHIDPLFFESSHQTFFVKLAPVLLESFELAHDMLSQCVPKLFTKFESIFEQLSLVGKLSFLLILTSGQQQDLKRHFFIVDILQLLLITFNISLIESFLLRNVFISANGLDHSFYLTQFILEHLINHPPLILPLFFGKQLIFISLKGSLIFWITVDSVFVLVFALFNYLFVLFFLRVFSFFDFWFLLLFGCLAVEPIQTDLLILRQSFLQHQRALNCQLSTNLSQPFYLIFLLCQILFHVREIGFEGFYFLIHAFNMKLIDFVKLFGPSCLIYTEKILQIMRFQGSQIFLHVILIRFQKNLIFLP